jgi:hypothetical protein
MLLGNRNLCPVSRGNASCPHAAGTGANNEEVVFEGFGHGYYGRGIGDRKVGNREKGKGKREKGKGK